MSNIRPLSEPLARKAQNELNEVPERIEEDLKALKSWMEQQPHLRARTDDQFLVAFLRGCKYSLEKTKRKLDLYYSCRTNFPDFVMNRDLLFDENLYLIRQGLGLPLPNTITPDGARITFIRPEVYDTTIVDAVDIIRCTAMINDILILDNQWTVRGGVSN
ncbi:CRAL/TRIO, N-terminal domain [Sergentomyia squamirostris]